MIRRTVQRTASGELPDSEELVIDAETGRCRQAGADQSEGKFILDLKDKCERDLYVFSKVVMKRDYLVPHLHGKLCRWLTKFPPYRKMLLVPRIHAKTSIGGHCLPCHVLIQPKDHNLYVPGRDGCDVRLMLAGETEARAMGNLRVVETAFEGNKLLRAFWPHRCWDNPRAQSKKWNEKEMIIPRSAEFSDPSIRALGVGVAIAGARVDFAIKDDLVGEEAMNSPTAMDTAIRWHINSRALYEKETTPEVLLGTRWAPKDLYEHIESDDPSVECLTMAIIQDGKPIWPERFTLTGEPGKTSIQQLQKQFGVMYFLFYMNNAADPELTDFDSSKVRIYKLVEGQLLFEEDGRDVALMETDAPIEEKVERGELLTPEKMKALFGTEEDGQSQYMRAKYG